MLDIENEIEKLAEDYSKGCEQFHSEGLYTERFNAYVTGYKAKAALSKCNSEWIDINNKEIIQEGGTDALLLFDNGDVRRLFEETLPLALITHWCPFPNKAALSKGNWTDEDLHLIKNRLIDILPTGMNLTAFDFVKAINGFLQEDWSEYLQSLKVKTT